MNLQFNPPAEFLKEETRLGYTISPEMKKVWAVQMDLLQKLFEVCKKYDLKIYADGGTTLGAVRHNGYIPWDDDIDMVMLREDYDKLMTHVDEFQHPYFMQTMYTDPHYDRRHAQLRNSDTAQWPARLKGCCEKYNQGICIDVFPTDFIPVTARGFSHFYKKESKARLKVRLFARFANSMPECIYQWMRNKTTFFSDKARCAQYEAVLRSQPKNDLACLCQMAFGHRSEITPYTDFGEPVWVDFEYIKMPLPQKAHDLLRRQYGDDYMTPIKAPTNHGETCFDTEHSYKEHLVS